MIEVIPSKQLFIVSSISPLKSHLIVKNISQSLIAFKIKSTAVQHFFVTPSIGQLKPSNEQIIQFKTKKIKSEIKDIESVLKAKFVIESKKINKQKQSNDDQIWNDKPNITKCKVTLKWQGLKTEIENNKTQQNQYSLNSTQTKVALKPNRNKQLIVILFLFIFAMMFGYFLNWYDGKRKTQIELIQNDVNNNIVQNQNNKVIQISNDDKNNTNNVEL